MDSEAKAALTSFGTEISTASISISLRAVKPAHTPDCPRQHNDVSFRSLASGALSFRAFIISCHDELYADDFQADTLSLFIRQSRTFSIVQVKSLPKCVVCYTLS